MAVTETVKHLQQVRQISPLSSYQISFSKQVVIDVKIPKESVGVVIGREGSNIKEIQAKTDTRINFKDELETETHRVAGIRGLPADVSYAEVRDLTLGG